MVIKTFITTFLIVSFNFLLLEIGWCQSPITFYKQLSVDNYLKDREVLRIDRDDAGYFWLLGTSAIQKYDGRFVTENISHSVVNPKYFSCLSDNSIILVSHEAQVYKIDKEEKTLERISTAVPTCPKCKIKDINLIGENLMLYYENEGEYLVFKTNHQSNYTSVELEDTLTLSQDLAVINFFKIGESYLLTTKDERLYKYKDSEEVELTLPNAFRATTESLVSNYIDSSSLYFSLPKRKGTFHFSEGHFKIIHDNHKLAFAKKDRKGKILLGLSKTYNHSETIYVLEDDSLTPWPELTKINQTYIAAYVEDIDDRLLLASHSGLYFIKMRKDGITPTHQSLGLTNGFGHVILSFAELPTGEIYYVKENKGIFKYNGATGPERLGLSDKFINNLMCQYEPKSKKLWIAGYTDSRNGVLFSYDIETEEVEQHDFKMPVMYFKHLSNDEILVSTSVQLKSAILKYNTKTQEIVDTIVMLENERARRFEYHSKNELLISTSKRLILYNISDQSIKTILPETSTQSIVPTSKGYAVCSRGKGAIFLDKNLNISAIVDEKSGLSNNHLYSIQEVDSAYFWVGTGNGLNVIDHNYKFVKCFDVFDGLSSHEMNTNAVFKQRNGNLLFGTINGVTEINPSKVLNTSTSSKLNIPNIAYFKDGEKISQAIQGNEINLPADAKDISLQLLTTAFYKFSNVDKPLSPRLRTVPADLPYSIKENNILIPKISEASTLLEILPSASLNADEMISLTLNRKRNYNGLFLALGIIFLGSIISYFIASRIIKFNKARDDERRENEVKMAELELHALRSQMNPHFIFNSLGAILLYIQTNEKKKAEKYLTKFAKLMRMFLESSKSKFISFEEEKELLDLYLELEKLRFEDKFEYAFDIDPRIDSNSLTVPSMLLQPFVENSINHGLYHRNSKDGILLIKAIPDGDKVKVVIKDNGIGREKSKEIQEASLKKHRSRATEIIQERISVLKKEKNIDIDIHYIDLVNEKGKPGGTEVIITLPKILKGHD